MPELWGDLADEEICRRIKNAEIKQKVIMWVIGIVLLAPIIIACLYTVYISYIVD